MHNKDLNILFWNARSLMKRKEDLPKILASIDIFVCVETWLQPTSDNIRGLQVPDFKVLRKDRTQTTGGGILIFSKNYLDVSELKGLDTATINLKS